ncbi:LuxR C-terminal-related transcriptional regulator [Hoeflea sp. AS60]|uniref:helix-turn-helix transcriptional regulator n=1 Tax=Hoeflea sp. AS60 TaxID=3135780 RepID=UPI00317B69AE
MPNQSALLDNLEKIRTETDLLEFLRRLSRYFDFTGFMLLNIPSEADQSLEAIVHLSDLPEGMIASYDRLGLLKNSLVFQTLRRSTIPMTLNMQTAHDARPSEEAQSAARLFENYSIATAAFFPVHTPGGSRAAFGFLGSRSQLTRAELGELAIFASHAFNIYSSLKQSDQVKEDPLTKRELEALHWAANGKTSGEIASIISLSEHTVNTYMNNAMRKLDCVNRTQLVAKALRLRLIY